MKVLFIGDIVGNPGVDYINYNLRKIKNQYNIDLCIANAENSAPNGKGSSAEIIKELYQSGIDVFTFGNHIFDKNTLKIFDENENVVRPANFSSRLPGNGYFIFDSGKEKIAIINLIGQINMNPVNSPFECVPKILKETENCDAVIVDFHAETTSEKAAMAHFLDGKAAAVLGTHTHVQTADEKILKNGCAFITDVGMTGPDDSILGVKTDIIVDRFVNMGMKKFEIADSAVRFNAVVLDIDTKSGKTNFIERVNII